jgi:hypothetical protein
MLPGVAPRRRVSGRDAALGSHLRPPDRLARAFDFGKRQTDAPKRRSTLSAI